MKSPDFSAFAPVLSGYSELRFQENRNIRLTFLNGDLCTNERASRGGVSARVHAGGAWGFASGPDRTARGAKAVLREAARNARFLTTRQDLGKPDFTDRKTVSLQDFSTRRPRRTTEELIEFLREVDSHILSTYPKLKSRTVSLSCLEMEKTLFTSFGTDARSLVPRTLIYILLSLGSDHGPVELHDLHGGLGHFEDHFSTPAELFTAIERQYGNLSRKAEGVFSDAGKKECILDADLAGILAHEAVGHTTEADFVLGGSIAADFMGRQVATPLVTLVDFANTALGRTCPVPVFVDDEGTKAEDVTVIDRGVLQRYMHNRASARHFDVPPQGNARAYQFFDEPLIRMRNTAFLPGNKTLDEMIASVEDGYYLVKTSNGQADSTGEFMFGITLGFEIRKGKLGRGIRDTSISGKAFEVLKTVTMVGNGMAWSAGGMCGKKQLIPVGMGGPALRCMVNIGGR